MNKINFDELCLIAMNIDKENGARKLVEETVKADRWYILFEEVTNNSPKPIVGSINNRFWIFGFTDLKKAKKFKKEQNIPAAILEMEPSSCIDWIKEYQNTGIYGIRFNEGKLGWYITINNLLKLKELIK